MFLDDETLASTNCWNKKNGVNMLKKYDIRIPEIGQNSGATFHQLIHSVLISECQRVG